MSGDFAALQEVLAGEGLNPIDRHFAKLMVRLAGADSPGLALAAALASRRLAEGHTCLDLAEFAGGAPFADDISLVVMKID